MYIINTILKYILSLKDKWKLQSLKKMQVQRDPDIYLYLNVEILSILRCYKWCKKIEQIIAGLPKKKVSNKT